MYLLNGWHYLVKLKAWREFLADRWIKGPPLAAISIENSRKKKKNCQKSLRKFEKEKESSHAIIRNPFKEKPSFSFNLKLIYLKIIKTPRLLKILSRDGIISSSIQLIKKVLSLRSKYRKDSVLPARKAGEESISKRRNAPRTASKRAWSVSERRSRG